MRVVRQIRGVDSNKLQPIIRHHNDKDFRVTSTRDIEPLDYKAIIFRQPQRRGKENESLEINESSELIMEDDDYKKAMFSRKRLSKSNEQTLKDRAAKHNSQLVKSIAELDEDGLNDRTQEDTTPQADNKYFNMLEEGSNQIGMMNMGSIDSNSEFATVNNKNNRKLKRLGQHDKEQTPVAFIEDNNFIQSQSFFNEAN